MVHGGNEEGSTGEKRIVENENETIFNAMVVLTLLYRCETWTLQKTLIND